jgi:hypothetical protein
MGLAMMDLSGAHMAEAKRWGERLVAKPSRPLQKHRGNVLRADGAIEAIRIEFGLTTSGEARDMIGRELRIRAKETMG